MLQHCAWSRNLTKHTTAPPSNDPSLSLFRPLYNIMSKKEELKLRLKRIERSHHKLTKEIRVLYKTMGGK